MYWPQCEALDCQYEKFRSIYVGNIYAYVSKAGGPHLKATQEYPGQLGLLASGIEIHSCAVMPIIYTETRILYLPGLKAPHWFHFQPCRPNRSQVGKLVRDQIRQCPAAKEPLDDAGLVFHDSGSESDDSGLGELIH